MRQTVVSKYSKAILFPSTICSCCMIWVNLSFSPSRCEVHQGVWHRESFRKTRRGFILLEIEKSVHSRIKIIQLYSRVKNIALIQSQSFKNMYIFRFSDFCEKIYKSGIIIIHFEHRNNAMYLPNWKVHSFSWLNHCDCFKSGIQLCIKSSLFRYNICTTVMF